MKLAKRILSLATTATLAITGLVATSAPAQAADNVGVYPLNINLASAPSNAKDYLTYNGKVYFTADSIDHGRAIFSTDATNPSGFTYFDSRGIAPKIGSPAQLFGFNNAIYYWDSPTNNWNTYTLYGKGTSSSGHFEVEAPSGDSLVTTGDRLLNAVTAGSKMYFFAAESSTPDDYKFWSIDTSGDITLVANIAFTPAIADLTGSQGYGTSMKSVHVLDGKIYVHSPDSGWQTNDGQIHQYDPATDTWATVDQAGSPFIGAKPLGNFRYNSQDVLVFAKRGNGGWNYYYLTSDGVMHPLGNITTTYASYFVNLGDRLFMYAYPTFSEVSATDGSLTNMISVLAPGAQDMNAESVVESNGKLVLMSKINTNAGATVEHLYQWDGTNPMTQIGEISPIAGKDWLPEYPSTTGWSRLTAMTAAGNGVIVNLYQDTSLGYEPYYVNLSGSSTALGNIDSASDGSAPDTDCSLMGTNSDMIVASVTGTFGEKSVITEFKQDGSNLQYKVLDLPGVTGICGLANDGTYTYFIGYDTTDQNDWVYKMDASHALTKLGRPSNDTYDGFVYNGNYFWLSNNDADLYMMDKDGVETQLTGQNGSAIDGDSVEEIVKIGSKLFFSADDASTRSTNLYSFDMATPTVAPVARLIDPSNDWLSSPRSLTVSGTKLYFARVPFGSSAGSNVYSIDSTTNSAPVKLFNVNSDDNVPDYVDEMEIIGTTFYLRDYDDNSNDRWLMKRSGTEATATALSLPGTFGAECLGVVGGELMLTNRDGVAKYLGNGGSTFRDVGITFANDNYALCDAKTSSRGVYFALDEQILSGGPWGYEPAYLGHLIPIAVERLGVAVTEAPATAFAGTTQPAVPAPTVTPKVDPDDINLGSLIETKILRKISGAVTFPDGSGFDIDTKGNIYSKITSKFLTSNSGAIKVTYKVGAATKTFSCTIKPFGNNKKKLSKAPTKGISVKTTKPCKLPLAALNALKTSKITIVQTLVVTRYWATTLKTKNPSNKAIKKVTRKMTVTMGKTA